MSFYYRPLYKCIFLGKKSVSLLNPRPLRVAGAARLVHNNDDNCNNRARAAVSCGCPRQSPGMILQASAYLSDVKWRMTAATIPGTPAIDSRMIRRYAHARGLGSA